jgi:hypothetical protein
MRSAIFSTRPMLIEIPFDDFVSLQMYCGGGIGRGRDRVGTRDGSNREHTKIC